MLLRRKIKGNLQFIDNYYIGEDVSHVSHLKSFVSITLLYCDLTLNKHKIRSDLVLYINESPNQVSKYYTSILEDETD